MARRTRSPDPQPSPELLAELKLSPEVAWYLQSRGLPLPDCPPAVKTPEPRELPGARFDPDRVDRVLATFAQLRHTKGKWAGRPLVPDPWQVAYVLAPVFGWVVRDDDGTWVRVIRNALVDVPRKNGKTTLAGGIAIYLTTSDGEAGAEVLAVAAAKNQAGYCFAPVRALAQHTPALARHVDVFKEKIVHRRTGSTFTVVSSIGDLLHGANVHGSVIDELHVHKTPDVVEAVETGTGARAQPLIVIITTADDSRAETIYARKRNYIEQLAQGVITDPSVYGVVFAADRDDDPFDEGTWRKANPGFGISPTRRFMVDAATKAKNSPAELASFLRLHLGIRTKQQTKYLSIEAWDRNAGLVDESSLTGRMAFGGLDLAATSDLCALCWLFPDEDGGYDVTWRYWTPEANVSELDRRTAGAATVWASQGWLTVTPGNVADYNHIEAALLADMARFDVVEVGYDPWNATQLVNNLTGQDAPMVPVVPGPKTLNAPTKETQRLLLGGTVERPLLRHGGNPISRWCVDNLAVKIDAQGNVIPDKARSSEKIDGVSALVTALARAMVHAGDSGELEIINF